MKKPLVLFGTGDLAQIAYFYFTRDTDYYVVGFTVDGEYVNESTLLGLPVVPFEKLEEFYRPDTTSIHVCLVYNEMNRLRQRKCDEARGLGYKLASYISPHAHLDPTATIGEHAFIFENNVIQPFVTIENNVILWSGNHVGHHSRIRSDNFISSHVVISGHCDIGSNSFIGVNATLANNTVIGNNSWVSHGTCISGTIPHGSFVKPPTSDVIPLNEDALARALERARR